jgi:hypothetical protein
LRREPVEHFTTFLEYYSRTNPLAARSIKHVRFTNLPWRNRSLHVAQDGFKARAYRRLFCYFKQGSPDHKRYDLILSIDFDYTSRSVLRRDLTRYVTLEVTREGGLHRMDHVLQQVRKELDLVLLHTDTSPIHSWFEYVSDIFWSVWDERDVRFGPGCIASNPDYLRLGEWDEDDDYSPRRSLG